MACRTTAAELQRRDEVVQVVHVGEVVEHEPQRHARSCRHRLGRGIGIARPQECDERVGHVAPGSSAAGQAPVGRQLAGERGDVTVGPFEFMPEGIRQREVEAAKALSRLLRRPPPRSLESLDPTFLSVWESNARWNLALQVHNVPLAASETARRPPARRCGTRRARASTWHGPFLPGAPPRRERVCCSLGVG